MQKHNKVLLSRLAIWALGSLSEKEEEEEEQRSEEEPGNFKRRFAIKAIGIIWKYNVRITVILE